ncbi:MAG: amino acid adenylation domain-containing protein [Caldilineaceae bacterium]|nr:amino acid adenylation domain-containing protein [Caldilineaceae bacterium]
MPDAVAVHFGAASLSYRELNHRANQLARYLRGLGVGPDVMVGICIERSLEMVVGLLGILKAGGAYVPLDPRYPPARLAFMLDEIAPDAGSGAPQILLTQQRLLSELPQSAAHTLCSTRMAPDRRTISRPGLRPES